MTDTTAYNILVVDDEPLLRTLLSRGLGSQGYSVTEAEHGQAALDACADQPFDLVLLDVSMPVMDGFTACRELRNRFAGMPIIMLTGYDDLEAINAAFSSGATDFMSKPISLPLVAQRIRYAMRATSREQELHRAYHDQNTVCRLARIGFWRMETRTGKLTWSKDAHELVGLPNTPSSLSDVSRLLSEDQVRQLKAQFRAALASRSALDTEIVFFCGQSTRCVRLMADNALDPDIISGAFQDITEQRSIENRLAYMAEHDYLTGLPKRSLFVSQLQDKLDAVDEGQRWLVLTIDIVRLQRINDAFGSEAGDQLLVMLARRLVATLPQPCLLARLEADCFVFALHSKTVSRDECERWLKLLLQPLEAPWTLEQQQVLLSFTIGYAFQGGEFSADQLLHRAIRARSHARPAGQLSLAGDDQLDETNEIQVFHLEDQLRLAMENDEFLLFYQPQLRLEDNRITSVEALCRWAHPAEGLLAPARFLDVIERIGLMPRFAEWVIRTACRQALSWQSKGLSLIIAVNLSPSQFAMPDLAERIVALCSEEGCPPALIEFEITESMAMHNPKQTREHLLKLKQQGFWIAIDDFGVGYSSLEYLVNFPHDVLKIDRTFVSQITDSKGSRAIVRAISSFCDSMNVRCLAEGVETVRQRDYLDALGIDLIQGFLLARPMPANQIEQLLNRSDFTTQDTGEV